MPLNAPEPPESSRRSLLEGLSQLKPRAIKSFAVSSMVGAPPEVSNPHQIFAMGLSDVAAGKSLDDTHAVGWRYMLHQSPAAGLGGAPGAAADVLEQNGVHRFAQLQQGWISVATQKAIEAARRLPEVAAGSFELRMLRLPALLLDALWLKNTSGGGDLVLPIASKSPVVEAGKVYAAPEFLQLIRGLAQEKLGFDDRPLESAR